LRKIIVSEMVTLDGYFAGLNGEIDWHNADDEFNQFAIAQLNEVDTLIFGRITYEGMFSYWTTPAAATDDPLVAAKMNTLAKIAFSKTLGKVEWHNTTLVREIIPEEIKALKEQPGKDMVIFGSGELVSSFARLELIDEYRLIVNPVVLGQGQPLFKDLAAKLDLKLLKTQTFRSGNVLLYYQPAKQDL
jgi:dihydrofolate reductase